MAQLGSPSILHVKVPIVFCALGGKNLSLFFSVFLERFVGSTVAPAASGPVLLVSSSVGIYLFIFLVIRETEREPH